MNQKLPSMFTCMYMYLYPLRLTWELPSVTIIQQSDLDMRFYKFDFYMYRLQLAYIWTSIHHIKHLLIPHCSCRSQYCEVPENIHTTPMEGICHMTPLTSGFSEIDPQNLPPSATHEMTSQKRVQKFHTDDASLPRSRSCF